MRYQILEDETCEGLVRQVQAAIAEKWVPTGGVSAIAITRDVEGKGYTETQITFYQAMTSN